MMEKAEVKEFLNRAEGNSESGEQKNKKEQQSSFELHNSILNGKIVRQELEPIIEQNSFVSYVGFHAGIDKPGEVSLYFKYFSAPGATSDLTKEELPLLQVEEVLGLPTRRDVRPSGAMTLVTYRISI